jgi:hypothetical protein
MRKRNGIIYFNVLQAEVKMRMEEILKLKTQLRLEKETVQQKEIEISRLNGQVLEIFLDIIIIEFYNELKQP